MGGGLLLGAALGSEGRARLSDAPDADATSSERSESDASISSTHQRGIDVPATPQAHAMVLVADLDFLEADDPGRGGAAGDVSQLSAFLVALQTSVESTLADPAMSSDGPADLTVTIGLGPRPVRRISPQLPGATDLPAFAGDTGIDARSRGGDLLLALHAADPGVVSRAGAGLLAALPQLSPRWQQRGFRGPGTGTVVRNPLGHLDGVIVPKGEQEMATNVWIGEGPAAGGTICVIRRLRLDQDRFTALTGPEQERLIGRRRDDGAPLSGGRPGDQVDLTAKTPDGQYRVPARSHARAAHPSFTGSALMLRRGYAFDNGRLGPGPAAVADAGQLFISFQRDVNTFVATQRRLDEQDDLMDYATPTASATFLILPAFSAAKPLGGSLIAAVRP